jgi:hypothetical protein
VECYWKAESEVLGKKKKSCPTDLISMMDFGGEKPAVKV